MNLLLVLECCALLSLLADFVHWCKLGHGLFPGFSLTMGWQRWVLALALIVMVCAVALGLAGWIPTAVGHYALPIYVILSCTLAIRSRHLMRASQHRQTAAHPAAAADEPQAARR
jgi:cytochrome bd-type quinol oxidase subunit 1